MKLIKRESLKTTSRSATRKTSSNRKSTKSTSGPSLSTWAAQTANWPSTARTEKSMPFPEYRVIWSRHKNQLWHSWRRSRSSFRSTWSLNITSTSKCAIAQEWFCSHVTSAGWKGRSMDSSSDTTTPTQRCSGFTSSARNFILTLCTRNQSVSQDEIRINLLKQPLTFIRIDGALYFIRGLHLQDFGFPRVRIPNPQMPGVQSSAQSAKATPGKGIEDGIESLTQLSK